MDISSLRIACDKNLESANSVMCDSVMMAEVEILSHLPALVLCHEIDITLKLVKVAAEACSAKQARLGAKKSLSAAPQSEPDEALLNQTLSSTDYLIIKEQKHLKQDGSLSSVALICPNVNQFLG